MSPRQSIRTDGTDSQPTLPRRRVLALGAGVGATLLAGCTGGTDPTSGSATDTGEFRLLISDRPADIADFERLDVTFSDARIFRADTEETTTLMTTQAPTTTTQNATATTTQTGTNTTATNETATTTESTEEAEEANEGDDGDDGDEAGFYTLDLEGNTVDLTQVIGEDATPVFEGELDAGAYTKIELNVAEVAGIVEGEEVDVKIPSEKLKITNNFAVTAEEPVEFVFDINVVKRGPKNGYILTPVISESGVAGRDVEYQEVPQNGSTSGA